jgi:hypothetical protein
VAIITPVFRLIIVAFRGSGNGSSSNWKIRVGLKAPQRERIGHEFCYDNVTALIFFLAQHKGNVCWKEVMRGNTE